jgi:hypothetical protein
MSPLFRLAREEINVPDPPDPHVFLGLLDPDLQAKILK